MLPVEHVWSNRLTKTQDHIAKLLFEAFIRKTFDLLFTPTSTTIIHDSYLKIVAWLWGFVPFFYNNTPDLKIFIIFWRWKWNVLDHARRSHCGAGHSNAAIGVKCMHAKIFNKKSVVDLSKYIPFTDIFPVQTVFPWLLANKITWSRRDVVFSLFSTSVECKFFTKTDAESIRACGSTK